MSDLQDYQVKATDWRESLRINNQRTAYVIFLFIIIYMFVGFFIDLYLYLYMQPNTAQAQNIYPITKAAKEIATFHIFPKATLIMLAIAGISLLIAYLFHRELAMLGTEYHRVTSDSRVLEEKQLYNVMEELKIAAALRFMPKIYIIEADYMNAFASGFSEQSAMVAITRGLLEKLDRNELQAVMAHELSHIRHNDIRLTFTVLVLSNIMLIAVDILFRSVLYGRSRKNSGLIIAILILRFALPILTLLLMLYLSRTREFMADTGSVELLRDNEALGRALIKIDQNTRENQEAYSKAYSDTPHEGIRNAAYFYDPKYANITSHFSINSLFSTHPSIHERLKALGIENKPSETPD